jgi:hypothetical protein
VNREIGPVSLALYLVLMAVIVLPPTYLISWALLALFR